MNLPSWEVGVDADARSKVAPAPAAAAEMSRKTFSSIYTNTLTVRYYI